MTARSARLIWLAFVLPGLCLLVIGIARAAERTIAGPHVITLYFAGKDYDAVRRTHIVLSGAYESRTECDVMITRVRVVVSGAQLRCDPVEQGRTQ